MSVYEVNGERLWKSLMILGEIGETPLGGSCRITLTELDKQGRDLFVSWGKEAGLKITIDKIGNIFMRREGKNSKLPPILLGSHLDTQPTGGKFDGCFGVMSALEVVRRLNDLNIETEAPMEIVSWTNEEGSRFVPVMMGSGVFAGVFPMEEVYKQTDVEGKSVGDELKNIGYIGTQTPGDHPITAYFEAHIEQGPILEKNEIDIGIVQGVLGTRWYNCKVYGQASHAGSTPMNLRKDALQVATQIMQQVVAIAHKTKEGRGTVGMVQVKPNSRNVVPAYVEFSIDLRNATDELVSAMDKEIHDYVEKISKDSELKIELVEASKFPAEQFAEENKSAIETSAKQLGYSSQKIISGAGHDAVYMSYLVPTGMIFIPCKDGISHNPLEYSSPEQVKRGADVLLNAALQFAHEV